MARAEEVQRPGKASPEFLETAEEGTNDSLITVWDNSDLPPVLPLQGPPPPAWAARHPTCGEGSRPVTVGRL